MPFTKYSKWVGSPLDGLSLEELLEALSEFLLESGFRYGFQDVSSPHNLDALRQAILERLVEMGRIPESLLEQWLEDRTQGDAKKLEELIDQVIRQLMEEGWIQADANQQPSALDQSAPGFEEDPVGSARFE